MSGNTSTPSPVPSFSSSDPASRNSTAPYNSDDSTLLTSASGLCHDFSIPQLWRPTIMACITAKSVEEQKKLPMVSIWNEIVRDLFTQMYAFKPKPDRVYCTRVAKELGKKYPFMKDSGTSVSGYVSFHCITTYL